MATLETLSDPHVTLVQGFRAAGHACGIKVDGSPDLALVVADGPCVPAAVFTRNRVRAAPVTYDRALLRTGEPALAVVANSGCANACTGERGLRDAERMARLVEQSLGLVKGSTYVMSTGVIGQYLPMELLEKGVPRACKVASVDGGHAAARAIMTTDTRPKEAASRTALGDSVVTVAGMCKGSGMIEPNMATMLGVLVTDIAIERHLLQRALTQAVDQTLNMVTVDGDTSTNDTVLLLANGRAGNPVVSDVESREYGAFVACLLDVATRLSRELARDGEGATKLVTVHVTGAVDVGSARQVAKSIANSNLVKTAVYGQDANWGRVLCAAGYSGVDLDPSRLALWMSSDAGSLHLVREGRPFEVDEAAATFVLSADEIVFRLDLGLGDGTATAWTCDLTHDYIDINAHYRT